MLYDLRFSLALGLVLAFVMLAATSLYSAPLQTGPTASLSGFVTDRSGKMIVGASVEATHLETNVTFPGETNSQGMYFISHLPPGTYQVVVRKFAYQTSVKSDAELMPEKFRILSETIKMEVQNQKILTFKLELGSGSQSIMVEGGTPLIEASPARGGNFLSREVTNLPLSLLSPISLARTLPGVAVPAGSTVYSTLASTDATEFSVDGQRLRANNYLLDSTDNNDFAFTGVAQPFDIADAVEEVSVQTGNFSAEFGRAGGGIFNVVTKSGTNSLHGTLLWRYQSQSFNSISNAARRNNTPQPVASQNVYGFTVGGPVHKNKTFFFGGFQQNQFTRNFSVVVPTDAAVDRLRSLFPSNRRLDMYLGFLGGLRGVANPISIALGIDPQTGIDRGDVQFASATPGPSGSSGGPQWLARLDRNASEEHRLAFRYIYDSRTDAPLAVAFPGFAIDSTAANQNLLFTDQYNFSPGWTNEFRFSYGRQQAQPKHISSQSVPEAWTLPSILIPDIAAPGVPTTIGQDRWANNFLFQETQTKLVGRHAFRYGAELLVQRASHIPYARRLGELDYVAAPGYSAFANFLDDFSGPGPFGSALKDFGADVFHPNQVHQAYFFQDGWLPTPSLSLTLGLRYENFGQLANSVRFPASAGLDPVDFFKPSRVNTDNNNFGPSFGLAWSPSFESGWPGKLFGKEKTVWRGGFQISYDAFYSQMVNLLLASSSPNGVSWTVNAPKSGRGSPNWFDVLPASAPAPSPQDPQRGLLEKDFRSPYTERWSFGFQRQLSHRLAIDGSYVGSESHKLTTWAELNPMQPNGQRLYPDIGSRRIRTSQGNSSYHAMQWRVDRRFARGFQLTASYAWSKSIDSTSEGIGTVNTQTDGSNLTWLPVDNGGLKLDRAVSDFDRPHALSVLYLWEIPGPWGGGWKHVLSGWSIAGIASFQSGAPFTLQNNSTGSARADIGNPNAPLNSRAVLSPICSTGYRNPDTRVCVNPWDVHFIERTGLPDPSSVGRNTLRTAGINNLDLSLTKSFRVGEAKRFELRWEAFNALNHPQYTQVPPRSVVGSQPSRFLNRDFTDSGIRSMWVQLKFLF